LLGLAAPAAAAATAVANIVENTTIAVGTTNRSSLDTGHNATTTTTTNTKSILVALGHFWCAEQSFEQTIVESNE